MARTKSARSPTGVSLSGPLRHALAGHAERRATYFFDFLFYLSAACDLIFHGTGHVAQPADIVREAATHQVDKGLRRKAGGDNFDATDPNVVNSNATSFNRIDAAHFCNLGLGGDFARLASLAQRDDDAAELVSICIAMAGDTVQLPQEINLGPDRVIDQIHYELAQHFLERGAPIFRQGDVSIYARRVDSAMRVYIDTKERNGERGLAECARCYTPPYLNLEARIAATVDGHIYEECRARGLDRARYSPI